MSGNNAEFKYACRAYLATLTIGELRTCGRLYGVANPTEIKKDEIIEELVSILSGERPAKERSKRGAPVKSEYLDPRIKKTVEDLVSRYFPERGAVVSQPIDATLLDEYKRRLAFLRKNQMRLSFHSSSSYKETSALQRQDEVYIGQLEQFGELFFLLPLDCSASETPLIMPVELMSEYALSIGDIVSCRVSKTQNALVVNRVTCVNNLMVGTYKRRSFEEGLAVMPSERLSLFDRPERASLTAKYVSWLTPVYKGQRLCIAGEPKSGKSELLYELVKGVRSCNHKPYILVYLCAQSAENVVRYKTILQEGTELLYSTYEDEPDRQVFMADFLLRRAKRLVEMGNDVVLCVDSLTALARAHNDTDDSIGGKVLAGGLESKTLLYLKRYFSAGRSIENGGTLTIIGTLSTNTGNPADDVISADILSASSAQWILDSDLARERMYPSIDLNSVTSTHTDGNSTELFRTVRDAYLPQQGEEALRKTLDASVTEQNFVDKILCK